ncbi:uncharacterized protein LOC116188229 isoform X1 [Punica granatum]|uniref:Uncharacterized protein LOC116188229 isoform X1 n=1 Tax=Punica granatum TaxID=22663 RepID=A0A6P8BSY7_PUNGR|nr:uncharacterized protein LOC116188229 isoform X1 [Punica granatum]
MGKSLPRELSQIVKQAAKASQSAKPAKPTKPVTPSSVQKAQGRGRGLLKEMESSGSADNEGRLRLPLSEVVSECVKRWFKDTLKEAKAGDINMQVLVCQMYHSGYGVPRDAQKFSLIWMIYLQGRAWMTRASRVRPSVWKVSDKRPGYNASDSDSDDLKGDS